MNYAPVYEHFPGVTAKITRMGLLHSFLNKLSFAGRYPDDELFPSGPVLLNILSSFAFLVVFVKTGLGGAQQAQISNMKQREMA